MPAETSQEAFRAELARLTYADLSAFIIKVAELTDPGEARPARR
jgi:hypothetical protein